jgi:xanthine/uracil permease
MVGILRQSSKLTRDDLDRPQARERFRDRSRNRGTVTCASGLLAQTAETTQSLSIGVAASSEQASANVQTVAAVNVQMSGLGG